MSVEIHVHRRFSCRDRNHPREGARDAKVSKLRKFNYVKMGITLKLYELFFFRVGSVSND